MSDWVLAVHKLVIIKQIHSFKGLCVCVRSCKGDCRVGVCSLIVVFVLHFYEAGGSATVKVKAKRAPGSNAEKTAGIICNDRLSACF